MAPAPLGPPTQRPQSAQPLPAMQMLSRSPISQAFSRLILGTSPTRRFLQDLIPLMAGGRKSFPAVESLSAFYFAMKMQVLGPLNLWKRFSPSLSQPWLCPEISQLIAATLLSTS